MFTNATQMDAAEMGRRLGWQSRIVPPDHVFLKVAAATGIRPELIKQAYLEKYAGPFEDLSAWRAKQDAARAAAQQTPPMGAAFPAAVAAPTKQTPPMGAAFPAAASGGKPPMAAGGGKPAVSPVVGAMQALKARGGGGGGVVPAAGGGGAAPAAGGMFSNWGGGKGGMGRFAGKLGLGMLALSLLPHAGRLVGAGVNAITGSGTHSPVPQLNHFDDLHNYGGQSANTESEYFQHQIRQGEKMRQLQAMMHHARAQYAPMRDPFSTNPSSL